MGNVNTTVNGRTCQRWASDYPHANWFRGNKMYPDGSKRAAGNKCRNPDRNWNEGVWCYTTDPRVRWEACDVPLCSGECIPRRITFVEYMQLKQLKQEHYTGSSVRIRIQITSKI